MSYKTNSNFETRDLIKDLTGEHPVYPGHALVVGFAIMTSFESLKEASEVETGSNYPRALCSDRVPGAGGEVYTGLDLLKIIASGQIKPEDALQWGNERWTKGNAGGHTAAVKPGLAQASKLEGEFLKMAQTWFLTTEA